MYFVKLFRNFIFVVSLVTYYELVNLIFHVQECGNKKNTLGMVDTLQVLGMYFLSIWKQKFVQFISILTKLCGKTIESISSK